MQLCEIKDEFCCGSAGIYNLVQPDAARELGDRKASAILATNAELVVSTNPGCLMQVKSALRRSGAAIQTAHLAEVLDASITGRTALQRLSRTAQPWLSLASHRSCSA